MRDSQVYKNDTFGLKTLDDADKLWFYRDDGLHMHFTQAYTDNYLIPMLKGTPAPSQNPKK
jgi:hypothetical protein